MKGNELVKFDNAEFGSVRVMMIDGEPWFVGKDIAIALGYKNVRDAMRKHVDDEDKGVAKCDTLGGKQELAVINESGLYSLILSSKLDSARQFKRWVTSEVLPSIRKTGSYVKRDDRWLETRQSTKDTHKPFTSAIRLLIGHLDARDVKFRADGWYYGHITNIVQNACDIIKGGRDNASVQCLNKCDQCQQMVANLILNLIAAGKADSFEQVEAAIIQQLNALNNLLGGQLLIGGANS